MTVRELKQKYPSIDWLEYFTRQLPYNIIIDDNELINVKTPHYIMDFEKLMRVTPKRIQANYAMARVVDTLNKYLHDEIRERKLQYDAILTGTIKLKARDKECIDMVALKLPVSISALYVRRYFNKDMKNNAVALVNDIKKQFNNMLQTVRKFLVR